MQDLAASVLDDEAVEQFECHRRSSRPRSSRTYKKENGQLRRAVADLTVEKQILKDIAEGNF